MSFRDRIKGHYAIDKKLGAGSFGEVYTCWDTNKSSRAEDDIRVIKVPDFKNFTDFWARFFSNFGSKTDHFRSFILVMVLKQLLIQTVNCSQLLLRKRMKMLSERRKY